MPLTSVIPNGMFPTYRRRDWRLMLLAWVIPVTAPGRAGPAVGISPAARRERQEYGKQSYKWSHIQY